MIITKEVETGLKSQTIIHYQNLGYNIPMIKGQKGMCISKKTKIIVKVEDLPKDSHINIEVKCDSCGKIKNMSYRDYLRTMNNNGTYLCQQCKAKSEGKICSILNTKRKNGESFETWCLKNNYIDILERWDYSKNICLPNEVCQATSEKYWFLCRNRLHSKLIALCSINQNNKNIYGSCIECDNFEQWCIDNNRQDILNRWDYELNKITPNKVYATTHKKYYLKCPTNQHKSELKNISSLTYGNVLNLDCIQCNSFAQWGIDNICEDFLEKYWDYKKNIKINPWELNHGSKIKVWIKCQEKDYHKSYNISCNDFFNGCRCPYCASRKVHPLDSLGKILEDNELLYLWSDKNKKSPYKYSRVSGQSVWWKCENSKHDDYRRKISISVKQSFRCSECVRERTESFIQEKVRKYIEQYYSNYSLNHESKCTLTPINPKTKMVLPFDNEIKDIKLIVEVHGRQHYEVNSFHTHIAKHKNTTPEHEFHYQKLKDRYKKFIAYINGYYYLEIPYWSESDDLYKKLIDDKITDIISNHKNIA